MGCESLLVLWFQIFVGEWVNCLSEIYPDGLLNDDEVYEIDALAGYGFGAADYCGGAGGY